MTTPDINETLRQHRSELAQKIHDQCDTIEAAAAQGKTRTVKDAVDQVHALADLLADIVIEPGLDDMARRLDQYAVELAENNEYDGARLVIETAEAFGRRHAQLAERHRDQAWDRWYGDVFVPARDVQCTSMKDFKRR
ncbi:hypothetical protein M1M07_07505 [Rhodococcus sp. HM1]|uniref:hypothetical protein n=1 Tax=Rhodococcus sp. HM1 TaxID=2937759 RepID=UPI00200A65AF|nr:hypothetical protein [Rhodococcus sp. HM1]MCK8670962.1 hypothetical protein [Rhodococcus sp. HM1]